MKKILIITWIMVAVLFCANFGISKYSGAGRTKSQAAASAPQTPASDITTVSITAVGDCTLGSDINSMGGNSFIAQAKKMTAITPISSKM